MNTQAIMNNFWFTQWAISQGRNSKPMTDGDAIITGAVLLVLIVALIALCVWLWSISRPIDVATEYHKKLSKQPSKVKSADHTDEDERTCPSLGAVGIAATVLSHGFLLNTTTHQTENKKEKYKEGK